jgi:hypothetical protein
MFAVSVAFTTLQVGLFAAQVSAISIDPHGRQTPLALAPHTYAIR